jgi:hypothetical protein
MHFQGHGATKDDNLTISIKEFQKTIEKIKQQNKKIVLIYDMPDITIDLKKCFSVRPLELGNRSCKLDRDIWKRDFDNYEKFVSAIDKNGQVEIFRTQNYLDDHFPINKNGLPMYSDKTHLSKLGSKFFTSLYDF